MLVYILVFLFTASVSLNCFLSYKVNKSKSNTQLDKDAQALLTELMSGPAVVKIEIVDKHSLIHWKG